MCGVACGADSDSRDWRWSTTGAHRRRATRGAARDDYEHAKAMHEARTKPGPGQGAWYEKC